MKESKLITERSTLTLQCNHMIQCTECRDYNLEKTMRCESCCKEIAGYFPGGCGANCPRNSLTVKASALCAVCGSHLRKEARCCKSSEAMKKCKKKLRSCMTVLVQRPSLVASPSPRDRPCSHYTLCQFCKSSVTKGHRSSTACRVCRNTKKRPVSFSNLGGEREPPCKVDKRCTLGTLAELAGAYEDDERPDDEGFSSSGADSPMDVDGDSPGISPGVSPYRGRSSTAVGSPTFNKRQALRFGERGGAPIWALVNPSD